MRNIKAGSRSEARLPARQIAHRQPQNRPPRTFPAPPAGGTCPAARAIEESSSPAPGRPGKDPVTPQKHPAGGLDLGFPPFRLAPTVSIIPAAGLSKLPPTVFRPRPLWIALAPGIVGARGLSNRSEVTSPAATSSQCAVHLFGWAPKPRTRCRRKRSILRQVGPRLPRQLAQAGLKAAWKVALGQASVHPQRLLAQKEGNGRCWWAPPVWAQQSRHGWQTPDGETRPHPTTPSRRCRAIAVVAGNPWAEASVSSMAGASKPSSSRSASRTPASPLSCVHGATRCQRINHCR